MGYYWHNQEKSFKIHEFHCKNVTKLNLHFDFNDEVTKLLKNIKGSRKFL